MSGDGDDKVVDFNQKFNTKELMERTEAARGDGQAGPHTARPEGLPEDSDIVPPLEDLTLLPVPGDPYKAHARPVDQSQHMLCLLFRGIGFMLLDYGNLDSVVFEAVLRCGRKPGDAPVVHGVTTVRGGIDRQESAAPRESSAATPHCLAAGASERQCDRRRFGGGHHPYSRQAARRLRRLPGRMRSCQTANLAIIRCSRTETLAAEAPRPG